MEAGDQNPEQAEESQNKERVVQPENTAGISSHPNACSDEHLFERKAKPQHKRITSHFPQRGPWGEQRSARLLLVATLVALASGCLADPQRTQSVALLERLVDTRTSLSEQPPRASGACTTVGDVQTRLTGEPGLVNVSAWPALHQAAQALQAVCGQNIMLGQPSLDSVAIAEAQKRWQLGIQREISVACDHLRKAATALDRAQPC